ncbi:hypothetical protein AB0942_21685 [Streptomyces nodosus]|uniref:hypothetical protein n=1 Tax=Streptomyces nodosus TaxID=40318 RepID=UPI003453E550
MPSTAETARKSPLRVVGAEHDRSPAARAPRGKTAAATAQRETMIAGEILISAAD